ncbi:hypothetical protein [Rossellomorea marisflavi]|uniref:hypothetical protein n=1 Tax=Rossellomorea marisflavi TaxID=189381 RepID=UPI002079D330|nr:hypothetical protein [Rossellomorea marisflavi]USK91093.1 hypothetical protein LIT29_16310 [Rossellomorea marisflavi]
MSEEDLFSSLQISTLYFIETPCEMDVKEKWNEDGNIKNNLKIVKIVKKEKKIDDMCVRLRVAGDGGNGGAEEPEVDHELSARSGSGDA